MDRTRVACDRCHELKVKCFNSLQGCRRCRRLDLSCTCQRIILKPGRKPTVGSNSPAQLTDTPLYPILQRLQPYGVGDRDVSTSERVGFPHLCSTHDACQLLENFFSSPNRDSHGYILRRVSFLRSEGYRETSAALLFCILCLSCYMPAQLGKMPLAHLNHGEKARMKNSLQSGALKLLGPVFLAEIEPSFDDAVAAFLLCSIATSDNEKHGYLPQWLSHLKFMVKQLNLNVEPEGFDEESKEERRRLWWSAYIVDRHSAFSFNMRPALLDSDCQNLYRACPDSIWESDVALSNRLESQVQQKGVDYEVHSLDYLGISVPLFAILGDVLEYHFILQHRSFGANTDFQSFLRKCIEQNIATWESSVRRLHGQSTSSSTSGEAPFMVRAPGQQWRHDDDFPSEPKLLLYGWHIFHCLHIVLYGKLDLIQMFRNTEWLLSNDFLLAAEHAGQCAKITDQILAFDPKLHVCYRLFGTYLLHSSFIFLILAKKLRRSADEHILNCCQTNLRSLDAFVATVNISYQKTFARVLRETLSKCLRPGEHGNNDASEPASEDVLDPELLKYRWTAGYNGLWTEDMGRPKEAKMRRFEKTDTTTPVE